MQDYRQATGSNGHLDFSKISALQLPVPDIISGQQTLRDVLNKKMSQTFLVRDGVIVVNSTFESVFASSVARAEISQFPWTSLTGLDLRGGKIRLVGPKIDTVTGQLMTEKNLRTDWKKRLAELQLNGTIPPSVAVIEPGTQEKGRRSRGSWSGLIILLLIVAGVPFFRGGGSLAAAALPGLADIAPDAVNLAIHNNPQWPAETRLKLRGIAATASVTPTAALTGVFGFQQNTATSLLFIPIYWAESFGSRDWQVRTLAHVIADNVNKPPAPRESSGS